MKLNSCSNKWKSKRKIKCMDANISREEMEKVAMENEKIKALLKVKL